MSIWDDIKGAFEDLFDYMKTGYEYAIYGIQTAMDAVTNAVEVAWRETSSVANTVADAFKDLGITISNGVIEGANTAIDFIKKAPKEITDRLVPPPPPDQRTQCNLAMGKAVGAVFVKLATDGEEYDTFRLLGMACDDKNEKAIRAAAKIVADRIGEDIYNIPRVAVVMRRKRALKQYLAWLISTAAIEKPEMMTGGKASQATVGLVTVAVSAMLCENKIISGFDWPGWEEGEKEDMPRPDAPVVWAEGTRLSINGAICLVLDGKVRHVPDPETYNNLFENWDNVIVAEEDMQAMGKPMTTGAYLASANGDEKVYLVNDGVKRWIASPTVLKKYHFNGKAVKKIPLANLNAIPTGNTIYHFTKKEGAVLKLGGGSGVFLLLDKKAHLIPNPPTFNNLFVNWSRIQDVNWDSIPVGNPITDGAYLASADGKVYFVNEGQKRWVMNPIAFNSFNFDWNKIRKQSVKDLAHLPEGTPIY